MWHHEHHFEKISENQTKMIDLIHYKIPLGPIGKIVDKLLVRP